MAYNGVNGQNLDIEGDIPVFCTSARQGLEAKLKNCRKALAQSGIAELETHLIDFLLNEKFTTLT